MTTYPVEPTDKTLIDAGEAYLWINEQSEVIALRWYEGLLKAFRSLEKIRPAARSRRRSRFSRKRGELGYGKYRILFTIEDEAVFALRVRHGVWEYLKLEDVRI